MQVNKFGYEVDYIPEFIDLRPYADLCVRRHWKIQFPNGYGASIWGSNMGCYGDGIRTFEVAVLYKNNTCYDSRITSDVLGYQTEEEVHNILKQIENLT